MTETSLNYETSASRRRSKLAWSALISAALAAALLAFAVLEGSSDSDLIGIASLPIALIGAVLAVIALYRKSSRGLPAVIAAAMMFAYWASVAAMIVPKLLAGGF